MAGPISIFCGERSGSFGSNLSITSIVLLPSGFTGNREIWSTCFECDKVFGQSPFKFFFVVCFFLDNARGLRLRWTSEIHPMHTRNISSGMSDWLKVVIVISPAAFEHRDVVLLSLPGCEVDAGLQSVLVERLQDHSLCIHVYTIHNIKPRKVWISEQELLWCVTGTQSHLNCPPGSRGWLWASDTSLELLCFCPASDKHEENNIRDGWRRNTHMLT